MSEPVSKVAPVDPPVFESVSFSAMTTTVASLVALDHPIPVADLLP